MKVQAAHTAAYLPTAVCNGDCMRYDYTSLCLGDMHTDNVQIPTHWEDKLVDLIKEYESLFRGIILIVARRISSATGIG